MPDSDTGRSVQPPRGSVTLRIIDATTGDELDPRSPHEPEPTSLAEDMNSADAFLEALEAAEERARSVVERIEHVQSEFRVVHNALSRSELPRRALPHPGLVLRVGVLTSLMGLLGLALWARHVSYALRVTSDTPTFLALITDMAEKPFAQQSPYLAATGVATQHATPYMQALAFMWRALHGASHSPTALANFLALVGIVVFGFTLWCVFLYVRRLAGATAAWVSIPILLGIFGPPHVIWASDLSLHAALYAGFFPQNVAIGTTLLTLLVLERRSRASLVPASLLATLTMLIHPFTGVLLGVLATAWGCRLALRGDPVAALRAPIALGLGFALGVLWPAYSLDQAFAETGMRGVVFIALCVGTTLIAAALGAIRGPREAPRAAVRFVTWLASEKTAFRLAVAGALGTAAVAIWELVLVRFPPSESARLAIYWVDGRWRWPLLFVAGTVGISGLARLARRGQIVAPLWFGGCFLLGAFGAAGLPLPVWYRFLLLCQIPLAVGVATVVADARRGRITAIVAATFALALGVKVCTLVETQPRISYFGTQLQSVWSLSEHIPPGPGIVATDPATAYFIPAVVGRRVLTVDKGHVSSNAELAQSAAGYQLLRSYYAGGPEWWQAGQQMWRQGVRYVVIQKQTTLEPKTLDDFIWQTARLHTPAQRAALGNYFYENNRTGTVIFDSPDYTVYRLDHAKLFPGGS
jgi:hypothetical protein